MAATHDSGSNGHVSRLRWFFSHPLTRITIELGLFLGILVVLKLLVIKPGLGLLGLTEEFFRVWQGVVTIAAMFGTYILIMRIYERRDVPELGLGKLVPDGLFGLACGTAMVSVIFALLYLAGAYQVTGSGLLSAMIVPAIWVVLLAAMEEFMFRGMLYRILEQWLGTIMALCVSAVIFGALHIFNEHADVISVLSATSGGLLMGVLYSLTGRLWIPIFFHASWNFTQAIFGSTVSGTELLGTYFEGVREGPEWLTGGPFGVENSVLTIALLFIVIAVMLFYMKKRNLFIPRDLAKRKADLAVSPN